MSTPRIKQFTRQVRQSPELQQKMEALGKKPREETLAGLVLLSSEAGIPVSAEEWVTASRSSANSELTDADLDTLSGGWDMESHLSSLLTALIGESASEQT